MHVSKEPKSEKKKPSGSEIEKIEWYNVEKAKKVYQ